MKKCLLIACLASVFGLQASAKEAHAQHWSYSGSTGAHHWASLESDFATCKLGKQQSPVDIRGAVKSDRLPTIGFDYVQSPAKVVNNGHTIQVNLENAGQVKLASGAFKLLQFHFHTPSEERINGKAYPLVAHMVHQNETGQLAVVAVLFKLGKVNPALAPIFAAMPAHADASAELAGGVNPADLLPSQPTYFAFTGSLTTPPCSENVLWQVLKHPVEMSKAQLAQFKKLYQMNARPVQPLNGRTIELSH